jgi:TRAP-type mannitol/chloroaromatic compound transport system permease large subunit
MMLLLVLFLIFLLGWPFEWPAIILVFLPIFFPVIVALKFDLVWFGALVAVVMQTAYLSPPVAMSAYYLKQVVPTWSLGMIYKGMFDFMFIQVIAILIVFWFPQIALWLPTTLAEKVRAERMAPPSLEQQKEEEGMMKGGSLEEEYKGDGEEKKDDADKKGG